MTLPAFANVAHLEDRLPGGIDDGDLRRAQAALEDASAIIRDEAGKSWVTDGDLDEDVPGILLTICVSAARRSFVNPGGATSETTGPFGVTRSDASPDVYLTKAEKAAVRRAAGKTGGISTISTTREEPVGSSDLGNVEARTGNVYVDVDPAGAPMPFLEAPELG